MFAGSIERLLAFVDAELFMHLKALHVTSDLYAVSWVMTWFAHTVTVHGAMLLWDRFLSGHPLLPLLLVLTLLMRDRQALLALPSGDLVVQRLCSTPLLAPLQRNPHPKVSALTLLALLVQK